MARHVLGRNDRVSEQVRIMVLDDDQAICLGWRALAQVCEGFSVVRSVASPAEAFSTILELSEADMPNLMVVEPCLIKKVALAFIEAFCKRFPEIPVLVYSCCSDTYVPMKSLQLGAKGFVEKNEPTQVLLDAIKTVCAGGVALSQKHTDELLVTSLGSQKGVSGTNGSVDSLRTREFEVAFLMSKGYPFTEIARILSISHKTVTTHLEHIKKRLCLFHKCEVEYWAQTYFSHYAA